MNLVRAQWLRAALACVVLACGCSTVRIRVPVHRPAAVEFECRKMAVLPFEGPNGGGVAAVMQGVLPARCEYDLVERQRIQDVIDEQGLQRRGAFDAESAVQLGRFLGASHVLLGSVITYDAVSDRDRRRTMVFGPYTEEGHTKIGPHEEWRTVFALRADVMVNFRVVDVGTGQVIASRNFSAPFRAESLHARRLPTPGGKLAELAVSVCEKFADWLCGRRETARKSFMRPNSSVPRSERHVGRALKWLEQGDLEEAEKHLRQAVELDPEHAAAWFDLAVVLGLRGHWAEGMEALEKAEARLPAADLLMETKVWLKRGTR